MIIKRAVVILFLAIKAVLLLGCKLAVNFFSKRKHSFKYLRAKSFVRLFEELGPTFIKIGQLLSTRRDLFSSETLLHLSSLQDDITPLPFNYLKQTFKHDFQKNIEEVANDINHEPVASASIASVFKGKLKNGKSVALKIKRPHIARIINQDLYLMNLLVTLFSWLPSIKNVPMKEIMGELSKSLRGQIDLRQEALANKRLAKVLSPEVNVVLPSLIEEYCSESILTMEYMEEVEKSKSMLFLNRKSALSNGLKALYRMIFIEGYVHCDMHPGNFHILDNGKVILLDFGLMADLTSKNRIAFAEFFYAMVVNDGYTCTEITLETAYKVPKKLNREAFSDEIISLVDKYSGLKVTGFQVSGFVIGMFDIQRKYKVRGTSTFIMAIISLLVFEGVAKTVDPELDFQMYSIPYIQEALNMRRHIKKNASPEGAPYI